MADIEERSITRVQQRHNFQANRFLYHVATNTRGRIRPVSIAAQIPQVVVRRRLRRGWSAYDAVNTPYVPSTGADSLLAAITDYWRMDETSGNRLPAIGSNILFPSATIGSVAGKNGNAASFDEGEYLYTSPFSLPRPYSIAMWIYVPSGGSWAEGDQLISKNAGGGNVLRLEISDDGSISFIANINSATSVEPSIFEFDTWTFYVFNVGADGRMKASKNGENLISGGVAATDPSSSSMQIGSILTPGSFAKIDSLFIFNREITQAEIARLYNSGAGYFP